MEVPGLGEVTQGKLGWYHSKPIPIPMFGGQVCCIVLDGYDEDHHKEDFHIAIANFLAGSPCVLRDANESLFRYYKDFEDWWLDDERQPIELADVWCHIQLGTEPTVTRRAYGDNGVYVSVECGCDWEDEHDLQIVLKNGLKVTKLGGYDGHLTNSDAYANDSLEHIIYHT